MSPFVQFEQMIIEGNTRGEVNDVIYDDIVENIDLAKLRLEKCTELSCTNELNKKLKEKLVEEQELTAILNEKSKQLSELNLRLECVKSNYANHRVQYQYSHQIAAAIFDGHIRFNSKIGQEIRQRHESYGFNIEYRCEDDRVIAKVFKDEKWIEMVINEALKFQCNFEMLFISSAEYESKTKSFRPNQIAVRFDNEYSWTFLDLQLASVIGYGTYV